MVINSSTYMRKYIMTPLKLYRNNEVLYLQLVKPKEINDKIFQLIAACP